MKQECDTKTMDMLVPGMPGMRRGRPPTGAALTPAERQRRSRAAKAAAQIRPLDRVTELARISNDAVNRFSGNADELEKALGLLMIGDFFGWKVLAVIHNKRTLRKYEEILGISIREFFVEEGPFALRSPGYSVAKDCGNFWKAVSGDVLIEDRRQLTIPGASEVAGYGPQGPCRQTRSRSLAV